MKKILVVGNGGREHTLLWKLHQDDPSLRLFATRPNAGMAELAQEVDLAPTDVDGLASWAQGAEVDLVVVGPEAPLASGLVDRLSARRIPAFGPTESAARIEASKAFAKELMDDAGVPTAGYRTFTDPAAAEAHIREQGPPIVVKASGLAAGKGAIVCSQVEEAVEAAREMLSGEAFGDAGGVVVVEECMEGEELSVFGLADGTDVLLLLPSQDHKRVGERDTGPNTGGMGAYAPLSFVSAEFLEEVRRRIFLPTLEALVARGAPFRGILYAGLMLTEEGPKVVEFNCRFGDPEAQVVLPLLDSPLLDLLIPVASGSRLDADGVRWRSGAALTTVVASPGYPGSYPNGLQMELDQELFSDPEILLFHAGTAREERGSGGPGALLTDGGRVAAVTGLGETLEEARDRSLRGAEAVRFEGANFRRDIGWREFSRSEAERP